MAMDDNIVDKGEMTSRQAQEADEITETAHEDIVQEVETPVNANLSEADDTVTLNGSKMSYEDFTAYKHRVDGRNGIRILEVGHNQYRTQIFG